MELYPAIDLRGGRCVRLLQGQFDAETVYSDDPVQTALRWQSEGARWLHVVDLDGAREGTPQQLSVLHSICEAVHIPVQFGGGLRSEQAVAQALEAGATRVVLGSVAVTHPEFAQHMFREWGERVVLGVDVREGKVAIRGWQEQTEVDAVSLIQQMANLGARRVIVTDISRDGTLQGPNLELLQRLVEEAGIPIIASGGVSCLEDLLMLKKTGVEGTIIGRALYTGSICLKEALEKVRQTW
ncbi:MAG: 1-(5-phosphoribosyl)-5-[(5-phosphoribosylamino) methylideneamino] imidazole-4-carboxamide isomerase [Armatimonadota bacterium]|nr:MAG: 1-(5-phosphoribosyl)-5-[(5-phosphoribosylamino) methylideneamino] imidazole-4-carboxamide isomerase [Armatimonadota bacterium]